jgi:3-dehydroquinate synthase
MAALQAPPQVYSQRFEVAYAYPVVFTRDVLDPGNDALVWAVARADVHKRHRCYAVIDGGLDDAWPELRAHLEGYVEAHREHLELVAEPLVIPGGEAAKNDPRLVADMQLRFGEAGLDRHAYVLIFGGGAVLDAAGYAAATTHRGLRVVRLPSTVLAQNDAGIGVKNGVNALGTKNYLGTFAVPAAVVNDITLLETLSPRDRIAGMAEAVKVGLIRDAEFFGWLEANADALARFDESAAEHMIRRCAELHLDHIRGSGDPFETGSARPLDYGHWSAHKLEALSAHHLRHGEAVAIGMLLDARYAATIGTLPQADFERIAALLRALGLPRWHDALAQTDPAGTLRVLAGLDEFREHLGGELTITLLEGIGRGIEVHEVDRAAVRQSIDWMHGQYGRS